MNNNVGIQSNGVIAWDGTAARLFDITKYTRFGWVFEVVDVIAVDAVFKVVSAPPNAGNPCIAGTPEDVQTIPICDSSLVPGDATITIPAGTPVGTMCSGTIPCYPNKFVGLASVSGDTDNVRAVMIRTGPTP